MRQMKCWHDASAKENVSVKGTNYAPGLDHDDDEVGYISATRQTDLETWMKRQKVDVALLQETHVAAEHRYCRSHYTWYLSGGSSESNYTLTG